MRRLAHMALALVCLAVPVEARASAPSDARAQADLLAQAGEARYRLALLRPGRGDLEAALRALDEARSLDPANLRALAYLGLARLEAAKRPVPEGHDGAAFDPDTFASACEPLAELFRLAGGFAGPLTRAVLRDVVRVLDETLRRPASDPVPEYLAASGWWASWRERVTKAAESAAPAANVVTLVEDLRTSPLAWVRERAAEKLAERRGKPRRVTSLVTSQNEPDAARPQPGVAEALALALREDESPWVRAAAAKGLAALKVAGWDIRLAEALRNDGSVFVRRTCAKGLAQAARAGRPVRAALLEALGNDTPRVASPSAWSLGALGGSRETLVQALASESGLVRSAAAMALRKFSLEAASSPKIVALLSHERAEVRAASAFALGTGPDHLPEPVLERVVILLGDEEAEVRAFAATALFNRPAPDASRARLRSLLDDEDPLVRLSAADTLLAAGEETALPVLEKLVGSKAPLRDYPEDTGVLTVGDAARRIILELGKKRKTDLPREKATP